MLSLYVFILIAVSAVGVAVYVWLADRSRREIIGRSVGEQGGGLSAQQILVPASGNVTDLRTQLRDRIGAAWDQSEKVQDKLVQAGYDTPTAPLTFATARVVTLLALPLLVLPAAFGKTIEQQVALLVWAFGAGYVLPTWYLNRLVFKRQERIRRSVPDALDLLVVCIEAGVSLDAAIQRVARELRLAHADFSSELTVVVRKVNAGVTRDQALRGLFERTGVEEVRALVSTLIQSERLGTSISRVLAVYAEALRRKRRQAVEKKAATAPTKMLFPLILLILPALFTVVMGPSILSIGKMFKEMGAG